MPSRPSRSPFHAYCLERKAPSTTMPSDRQRHQGGGRTVWSMKKRPVWKGGGRHHACDRSFAPCVGRVAPFRTEASINVRNVSAGGGVSDEGYRTSLLRKIICNCEIYNCNYNLACLRIIGGFYRNQCKPAPSAGHRRQPERRARPSHGARRSSSGIGWRGSGCCQWVGETPFWSICSALPTKLATKEAQRLRRGKMLRILWL